MRWVYVFLSWIIVAANANPVDVRNGVSGNFQINNFNSGQGATANTFWSGDGTWKNVGATAINVPRTANWFSNDSPPANIIRFGDPFLVGDAATNYTAATGCPIGDIFTNFENTTSNGSCAYISSFQMVVESKSNNSNATGGLLAVGQTKLNNSNGAFGVAGFALGNNANSTGGGWAFYGECDQTVLDTHIGCIGMELDDGNFVSDAQAGLPDPFTQSAIVDLQLACGSGVSSPTTFKCGAAAQVVPNNQPFKAGFSFLSGSVAGQSLFGGTYSPAIVMPNNYSIFWYSAAGNIVAGISADSSGNVLITGAGSLKYNGTTISIP